MLKTDTFQPTKGMKESAARGLELRSKFGRGGTPVGARTARTLVNDAPLPMVKIKQICAYFMRHEGDKRSDWANTTNPTNGYIAWLLWGGDSGAVWAKSVRDRAIKAGVWYKSDANIPVNEKLWAKCQAEAKRKYRIHPTAYSNGYAVKVYERLGGKWRSDSQDLRLDYWKRIGANQRGQKCDEGRGWIGLKGSCKRSKKSLTTEQKTKLRKESAVGLADKIRAKKGMRDRNAPKIKKKPHELSSWEWAKAYRPEVVARLEAGWASQGTRKGNTQASADLTYEHKALVERALAKGEKVQKSILSEHQIRTSSESWRSEKGRIALSMDRTIVAFKDDQSMGLKVKPKPEEIANILIENSKKEVDVKFRSRSDRETKSFMKRIEAIAELAGYSVTSPSGRVEQGYDFPEQYVVTMHLKRPSSSTTRSDALDTWFKEKWVGFNSSGKVVGECGSGDIKGKVKCLPASKARSLSKRDRSRLAKQKQRNDPKPGRSGAPVMVSSKLDSMNPRTLARAIVSIEQKYGFKVI